jgi:hypothetical protein
MHKEIPSEVVEQIVSYLPIEFQTVVTWERVNKQFYCVAEQYWKILFDSDYPTVLLRKNYRFAYKQLYAHVQRKKPTKPYRPDVSICVAGGGGVGKSSLTARYIHYVYITDYDPTVYSHYLFLTM